MVGYTTHYTTRYTTRYITRTPQFRVVFVSQWWTRFELAWFYFWTTTTLLAMFFPGIGFFSVAARNGLRWVSSQPCGEGPFCCYRSIFMFALSTHE